MLVVQVLPVVSAQRISIKGVFLTIGIVKHVDNMVRHPKEVKVLVVVFIHVLQICMILVLDRDVRIVILVKLLLQDQLAFLLVSVHQIPIMISIVIFRVRLHVRPAQVGLPVVKVQQESQIVIVLLAHMVLVNQDALILQRSQLIQIY